MSVLPLLLSLVATAAADPPLPAKLLLALPGDDGRSAFLVLVAPEQSPRLLAPADHLAPDGKVKLTWAGTDDVALKLKAGVPDAVGPACAPGDEILGSRAVPQRLASAALEFAPGEPQPLEHVWLVSRSSDGTRVHAGTVERLEDGVLHYVLQQPVPLLGSVGAPVVDVLGRVVGVHLGVSEGPEGRTLGQACGLVATRQALGPAASP